MEISDFLIFTLSLLGLSSALEEASPEVYLTPRNFNPHPYEFGYDPSARYRTYENFILPNNGPVLFPRTPEISTQRNPYVVIRDDHPVNRHPYPVVAKKKKYTIGLGRFKDDTPVNPQVYKALAASGARVLKVPQAKDLKHVNIDGSFSNQKKDYAFSYKVLDHLSGDDFSHTQSQNAHATNGEYRVKLPDGRIQIVSYTADKNGYKADVKYADDDNYVQPIVHHKSYVYQEEEEDEVQERVHVILPSYTKGGQFIASTLAPYTPDDQKGLDKFNPVYIKVAALHYKK